MGTIFEHSDPPRRDKRTYPIDYRGQPAKLRLTPIEGPDSEFAGRPVGPVLPRCKQKGCFNMLLWIVDDLKTRLPLSTLCGHCGETIKYPPSSLDSDGMQYAIREYAQVKSYLIRMLKWELDNTPWRRHGDEYYAAVFTVYESLVGNVG